MEQVSVIVLSAAIGGAAGKLVDKVWGSGEKWLEGYFKDHQQITQEKAKSNALNFIENLGSRVKLLEEKIGDTEEGRSKIDNALNEPDFSALLQAAIISSAKTSSADKHEILGRLVAERLNSDSEGLLALTSSLAVDVISHLSSKHLSILGLASLVYGTRPHEFTVPLPMLSPEQSGELYLKWLEGMLSEYLPGLTVSRLDWTHLMSVACLKYEPVAQFDLKKILSHRDASKVIWSADKFLSENKLGSELQTVWDSGMRSITLTTVGTLIGVYVHDLKTGIPTTLNW